MDNFHLEELESASIELGLRNRPSRQQLFTPSPLITPSLTMGQYKPKSRGVLMLGANTLIDFDQELNPTTSSHGSLFCHKGKSVSPIERDKEMEEEAEQEQWGMRIKMEEEENRMGSSTRTGVKIEQIQPSRFNQILQPHPSPSQLQSSFPADLPTSLKKRVTRSRSNKFRTRKSPHTHPMPDHGSQAYSPRQKSDIKIQRRGRKRMYGDLQELLVQELKINVMSRLEIQEYARNWGRLHEKEFSASNGWYQKFINRLKVSHPMMLGRVSRFEEDKRGRKIGGRGRRKSRGARRDREEERCQVGEGERERSREIARETQMLEDKQRMNLDVSR